MTNEKTGEKPLPQNDTGGFTVPPEFRFVEEGKPYRYYLGDLGFPSPTSLIKEFGLIDDRFFKEFHANRGRAVHKAIQYDNEGVLDESNLDPRIAPHVEAFRKFKRENLFEPIARLAERPLFSRVYAFGVTPDCPGFLGKDHTPAVVEIKSGVTEHWTFALQTAAQQIALFEMANFSPVVRVVVQTRSDGSYKLKYHDGIGDRDEFLALVRVHWLKRRKK